MNYLDALEAESIYILREAYSQIEKPAMLWSLGKDSNVMVWLCLKAFSDTFRFRSSMSTRKRSFRRCTRFATSTRRSGTST